MLKSDLKQSQICPIWGQSDLICDQLLHPKLERTNLESVQPKASSRGVKDHRMPCNRERTYITYRLWAQVLHRAGEHYVRAEHFCHVDGGLQERGQCVAHRPGS